ncbi:hypothetical protein [Nocardia sp. CA-290969]|uniref:hypothetical protein n=1 Tax=Nocardia sp. CA-290969 TaxID=3239986 RepID=UPI003D935AFC
MSEEELIRSIRNDPRGWLATLDERNDRIKALAGECAELRDSARGYESIRQHQGARIAELEALVGQVRAALAGHPRCDVHPDADPVSCGWKRAVADVQRALDTGGPVAQVQSDQWMAEHGRKEKSDA